MTRCARLFSCVLILSAASAARAAEPSTLHVEPLSPKVRELLRKPEDGLTPAQRYAKGMRCAFPVDVKDDAECSQVAARRLFPGLLEKNAALEITNADGSKTTAAIQPMLDARLEELQWLSARLFLDRDPLLDGRCLCVGMAAMDEPNAISHREGYIVADPRILLQVRSKTGGSTLADTVIFLHEFAHQLQYWTENGYELDRTVRRKELAADCIATGLLAYLSAEKDRDYAALERRLSAIAGSIGDYSAERGHHGTPAERAQAAATGLNYVLRYLREFGFTNGITSAGLVSACNAFVNRMDDEMDPFGANK